MTALQQRRYSALPTALPCPDPTSPPLHPFPPLLPPHLALLLVPRQLRRARAHRVSVDVAVAHIRVHLAGMGVG
jgi:hypothetical protein